MLTVAVLLLCATVPSAVLLVPLFFWTRRLRRAGSPAFVAWISYGLIALDALLTVVGAVVTLRAFATANTAPNEPSQKARALAEGISEAMNCSASAVMLAALVALWLAVWRWRLVRR